MFSIEYFVKIGPLTFQQLCF